MPTYVLQISGTERQAKLGSFRVEMVTNGVDTGIAEIQLEDGSPTVRFDIDDEVLLKQDGSTIWGGFVTHVDEDGEGGPNTERYISRLTISGYAEILQRRHITVTADLGSPGSPGPGLDDFLSYLVTTYWAAEGVTLHPSQSASAVLKELAFEDALGTEILNRIATDNGLMWRVDEQKRLRMWAKGDIAAPYDINVDGSPDDPKYFGDIRTSKSRYHGYANRVIVKGPTQTILDYGETHTSAASQTSFTTTVPMIGTRQSAVGSTGNLTSLGIAVGETLWEGLGPEGSTSVWRYSISATTGLGTFRRTTGALPTGSTVRLVFDAEVSARGEANDLADQALYPIRDEIVQAPVTTDADAQDLAEQILPFLVAAKSVSAKFRTFETGLVYPGQTIGITASDRALSGEFLITKVVIANWQNYEGLIREIDTTQGEIPRGDWRDLIAQFAAGVAPGNISNGNSGGNNNTSGGNTTTNPDGDTNEGGDGNPLSIPPYDTDVLLNKKGAIGTLSDSVGRVQIIYQDDDDIAAGGSPGSANRAQFRVTSGDTPDHQPVLFQGGYTAGSPGTVETERQTIGWIPWSDENAELQMGYIWHNGQHIATADVAALMGVLTTQRTIYFAVYPGQTPGSAVDFSTLLPAVVIGGTLADNGFVGFGVGSKNGDTLGAAAPGPIVMIGANTSGSGAPGTLMMLDKALTPHYLWFDETGDLRTGTAPPEADGSPSDTSGTVVGTQS